MLKEKMYELIEAHYKAEAEGIVKKLSGMAQGRHNAEDVVQEAYTRALQYWDSFDANGDFVKWFSTILTNCLKDNINQERQHGAVDEPAVELEEMPKAYNQVLLRDIEAIVNGQPKNIRRILNLYFFKQFTSKEIANIVPESHTNIRHLILNFRRDLRYQLDRQNRSSPLYSGHRV